MEISFNDIVKMNMMKVQQTISSQALENFLGDMTSFAEERDPLVIKKSNLIAFEKILVEDTTENLYRIIAFNPVLFALAMSKTDLKKPEDVKGYAQNMQNLYQDLLRFEAEVETAVEHKLEHKYMLFRSPAIRESFTEFMKFMKQVMPFFEHAKKLDSICSKTKMESLTFFDLIENHNGAMRDALFSAHPLIGDWSDLGEHFEPMYVAIMNHFDEYSRYIESRREIFEEEEARKAQARAENLQLAKQRGSVASEAELARQKSIKEANELYEMFQMDFMRDLNREISMMNRDMYEKLLDKIEKFLQQFPMPLPSGTSIGKAEEAKAQIQRFIDTVGEISRNTYTPMLISSQKERS